MPCMIMSREFHASVQWMHIVLHISSNYPPSMDVVLTVPDLH